MPWINSRCPVRDDWRTLKLSLSTGFRLHLFDDNLEFEAPNHLG